MRANKRPPGGGLPSLTVIGSSACTAGLGYQFQGCCLLVYSDKAENHEIYPAQKIGHLAKESVRNIDKKLYIIAASSGVHLSIEEETSSTMIRAASIRSFSL